jgi:hypothetical protein
MKWLFLILVACGGKQQTAPDPEPKGVVQDTRTPIEKRRDVAAEKIAERATKCAVDDARRDLTAGKITKKQFDDDTKPELQAKLKQDWIKKFSIPLNSFQVRVLEVCNRDATTCDELNDCVQHINDKQK